MTYDPTTAVDYRAAHKITAMVWAPRILAIRWPGPWSSCCLAELPALALAVVIASAAQSLPSNIPTVAGADAPWATAARSGPANAPFPYSWVDHDVARLLLSSPVTSTVMTSHLEDVSYFLLR